MPMIHTNVSGSASTPREMRLPPSSETCSTRMPPQIATPAATPCKTNFTPAGSGRMSSHTPTRKTMAPPRNTGFQAPRSPCTTPPVTCSTPQTIRTLAPLRRPRLPRRDVVWVWRESCAPRVGPPPQPSVLYSTAPEVSTRMRVRPAAMSRKTYRQHLFPLLDISHQLTEKPVPRINNNVFGKAMVTILESILPESLHGP